MAQIIEYTEFELDDKLCEDIDEALFEENLPSLVKFSNDGNNDNAWIIRQAGFVSEGYEFDDSGEDGNTFICDLDLCVREAEKLIEQSNLEATYDSLRKERQY